MIKNICLRNTGVRCCEAYAYIVSDRVYRTPKWLGELLRYYTKITPNISSLLYDGEKHAIYICTDLGQILICDKTEYLQIQTTTRKVTPTFYIGGKDNI